MEARPQKTSPRDLPLSALTYAQPTQDRAWPFRPDTSAYFFYQCLNLLKQSFSMQCTKVLHPTVLRVCRLTATNNNHFLNPHHQSSTPAPAFFTFNICPRNLVVFVNSPGWICSCPNLGGKVPGLDVLGARCPSFTFSYSTLVAWSDF